MPPSAPCNNPRCSCRHRYGPPCGHPPQHSQQATFGPQIYLNHGYYSPSFGPPNGNYPSSLQPYIPRYAGPRFYGSTYSPMEAVYEPPPSVDAVVEESRVIESQYESVRPSIEGQQDQKYGQPPGGANERPELTRPSEPNLAIRAKRTSPPETAGNILPETPAANFSAKKPKTYRRRHDNQEQKLQKEFVIQLSDDLGRLQYFVYLLSRMSLAILRPLVKAMIQEICLKKRKRFPYTHTTGTRKLQSPAPKFWPIHLCEWKGPFHMQRQDIQRAVVFLFRSHLRPEDFVENNEESDAITAKTMEWASSLMKVFASVDVQKVMGSSASLEDQSTLCWNLKEFLLAEFEYIQTGTGGEEEFSLTITIRDVKQYNAIIRDDTHHFLRPWARQTGMPVTGGTSPPLRQECPSSSSSNTPSGPSTQGARSTKGEPSHAGHVPVPEETLQSDSGHTPEYASTVSGSTPTSNGVPTPDSNWTSPSFSFDGPGEPTTSPHLNSGYNMGYYYVDPRNIDWYSASAGASQY